MKIIISLFIVFFFPAIYASQYKSPSAELAAKAGFLIADKPLIINKSDVEKDNKTLVNRFFTFSYPECLTPIGVQDDDEGLTGAASVFLTNGVRCSKKLENDLMFAVRLSRAKNIEKIKVSGKVLFEQNIVLNGIQGKLLTSIQDACKAFPCTDIDLHRQIFVNCKENTIVISSVTFSNEKSRDIVNAKKFSFPDEELKIISTFKCPK